MTPIPPLLVDSQILNGHACIAVVGRLEHGNRSMLREAVELAIGAGCTSVAVDLAQCPAIDSAGLGCLISCARKVKAAGGSLALLSLQSDLKQLFADTRLESEFAWGWGGGGAVNVVEADRG